MSITQNEMAIFSNNDFTVINGTGFVSQTKLAELCGVGQNTISQAIKRNTYGCDTLNLSENNQLDAKSAYTVIAHYATQGRSEAIQTLALIGEAGMQAYIYHQAGYVMSAILPPTEPLVPSSSLLPTQVAYADLIVYKDVLELLGVTGNAAILGANQASYKRNSIDLLADVGHKHLLQPEQVEVLNVTDLGKRAGLKAVSTNLKLSELGLQAKIDGKWTLTDAGKEYGVLLDTSKKHGVGTPVLQLKWKISVLDLF